MQLATIAPKKYFNGVASAEQKNFFIKKLTENFNVVGTLAFGQMKFIAPSRPDEYNWEALDSFVAFTKHYNLEAHYNTVINNKFSFPEWYGILSPKQKVNALERHVKNVIGRYRKQFSIYKLVNEVVRDEDDHFFGTDMHKVDLLALLFKWAKEADPQVTVMVNDFGIILREDIRKAYVEMITEIQERGGPIDVVGLQGHLGHPSPYKPPVFQLPSDEVILEAIEYVHTHTSLPVHITEFDLSYENSPQEPYEGSAITPNKEFTDIQGRIFADWYAYQAYAYKHFYELCKSMGFVESLTFWNFLDSDTLPNERPGAGFFDEENNPKPAYKAMEQVLQSSLMQRSV